jgi:hypothetical protein
VGCISELKDVSKDLDSQHIACIRTKGIDMSSFIRELVDQAMLVEEDKI